VATFPWYDKDIRMTKKKDESLLARMKGQPLWFWGVLCFIGGLFANLASTLTIEASHMPDAEEKAARLGSGIATGLFIVAGGVLIVLYLVRGKRKK